MSETVEIGQPKKSFKGFMDTLGARMTEWAPDRATIEVPRRILYHRERAREGIEAIKTRLRLP